MMMFEIIKMLQKLGRVKILLTDRLLVSSIVFDRIKAFHMIISL